MGVARLVADLPLQLALLKSRYQQGFQKADEAWALELAKDGSRNEKSGLNDPALEELRIVLHDNSGPCRLPKDPHRFYPLAAKQRWEALQLQIAAQEKTLPELPMTMAVMLAASADTARAGLQVLGAPEPPTVVKAAEAYRDYLLEHAPGAITPLVDYAGSDIPAARCDGSAPSRVHAVLIGATESDRYFWTQSTVTRKQMEQEGFRVEIVTSDEPRVTSSESVPTHHTSPITHHS